MIFFQYLMHLVVKQKMRLRIPSITIVMFGSVLAATTFLEAVMTMEASAKTFLVWFWMWLIHPQMESRDFVHKLWDPTKDGCGGGTGPYNALFLSIRNAIENSSYTGRVTYVDISSKFVTAQSYPFSDKQWYADNTHLNEARYHIKLFTGFIWMCFHCVYY